MSASRPVPASDVGGAVVDLLSRLVGIDSANPGLVAGAAGEARIVDRLAARLRHVGFAVTVVPSRTTVDRPSLVAVALGDPSWPTVVLNGHVDTVGVAGPPRVPRRAPDDARAGRPGAVVVVRQLLDPQWRASAEPVMHRDGWRLGHRRPAADLADRLGAPPGTGAP